MALSIEKQRLEEAGELVEVTPFIQRLVEDWFRNVDFLYFKIIEARKCELSAKNDNCNGIFGPFLSITLKIKVRATINNCGKVIVCLEFWKGFTDVHFALHERNISVVTEK